MTQTRRNLVANFIGKGWAALLGLVFVPIFIRFLGIEAYGLVGFYSILLGVFSLLDLGLTTTLNRELAQYSTRPDKQHEMRDLVRTLETVYWGLAVLICGLVVAASWYISHYWIQARNLSYDTVQIAVALMGFVLAFQWPFGFYSGGLLGLQRQVLYNILFIVSYTMRFVGVLGVLVFISASVESYFLWQAIFSALGTILMAWALWRALPHLGQRPHFRKVLLFRVWKFAAGIGGIALTVLILNQMDKIILSKLLPLDQFGYYTLAWLVANNLAFFAAPFFVTLFPRFTEMLAVGDVRGLTEVYHRSCQLLGVVVIPLSLFISLFAPELLLLWTQNPVTVENTHLVVSLVVVGSMLNGIMTMPYAVQLANGWTSLALYMNVIAILILAPLLVLLAPQFGVVVGALIWLCLNASYVFIQIPIMHRRLLRGEQWHWYSKDVGFPLVSSLIVLMIARRYFPPNLPLLNELSLMAASLACAITAAALITPTTRELLINFLDTLFRRSVRST